MSGNAPALAEAASALRLLGDEHGFEHWLATAAMFEAAAALLSEDADDDSEAAFRSGLARSIQAGNRSWLATYASILARRLVRRRRFGEALAMAAEAENLAREGGLATFHAEWLRVEAEVLAETRTAVEAEARLRDAVRVAAAQGMRLFELRASTSLCRLLAAHGGIPEDDRESLRNLASAIASGGQCADVDAAMVTLV
jgi:hypothetical protein